MFLNPFELECLILKILPSSVKLWFKMASLTALIYASLSLIRAYCFFHMVIFSLRNYIIISSKHIFSSFILYFQFVPGPRISTFIGNIFVFACGVRPVSQGNISIYSFEFKSGIQGKCLDFPVFLYCFDIAISVKTPLSFP